MKRLIQTLVPLVFSLISGPIAGATEMGFQIIVNPLNSISTIDQRFLADIFLKKKIYWTDSKVIFAVDLEPGSIVRHHFSEKILDRPVSAVRNYWQQLLFSGRAVPPPEFRTEQEVMNFVASHEEAIGYVSGDADVGALKVLRIE